LLTRHQAWFVSGFQQNNQLTPNYILVLFIVSVLAAAWALATLIRMSSTRRSAMFVAFVDLCFVGALIGGVVELRGIASENCSHFSTGSFYISLGPFGYYGENSGSAYFNINKTCAMLKASFAFGIMNIIFFFITFILALLLHRHQRDVVVREKVTRRRSHGSRRGHSSRRSHSSRRQYYV
jgi:hypothetical protein